MSQSNPSNTTNDGVGQIDLNNLDGFGNLTIATNDLTDAMIYALQNKLNEVIDHINHPPNQPQKAKDSLDD